MISDFMINFVANLSKGQKIFPFVGKNLPPSRVKNENIIKQVLEYWEALLENPNVKSLEI